ncbi:MAG: TIM barrel protein, partial [Proteobacteria bacterium]|nr:TIM barrel protein [Pseudomonadota bacterium]
GQAVLDVIDSRHQSILTPEIWGDGDPAGVNARAAEELCNTARAAQRMGVDVVNGFTGSSIWHLLYLFPPATPGMIDGGFKLLAERFHPILDVFAECGVRFALEVHPTEIAFDLYTAQRALEALDFRPEFGFNFDPSHLIWQGVDPVEFIRAFPDRIYHVHMKDARWSETPKDSWGEEVVLGTGDADIPRIVSKLRAGGYSGPLVIEREAGMALGAVFNPLAPRSAALDWTDEAKARIARVPGFVRRMVRQRAEAYVRGEGRAQVTADDLALLARRRFGDAGPPGFARPARSGGAPGAGRSGE